jgi:hypothetical protein
MDEFQDNVDKLGVLADEIVALMPEEPATELEAKVAELLARLIQHLEYMEDDGEEAEAVEEAVAEEEEEV